MALALDIGQFRTEFPEFADTNLYPNTLISFWAGFAQVQVRQRVWGCQWMMGVKLYTAHEIVLATQNKSAATNGGSPGQQGGIASAKTVGSVNVSYDANTTTEKDAGYWNLTTYGKQFIRLARIFGAGAVQL